MVEVFWIGRVPPEASGRVQRRERNRLNMPSRESQEVGGSRGERAKSIQGQNGRVTQEYWKGSPELEFRVGGRVGRVAGPHWCRLSRHVLRFAKSTTVSLLSQGFFWT